MLKTPLARWIAGFLATIPILSGITYILMANLQQHVYGELGVRPADVGLDHSRVADETFGLTITFALGCAALASLLLIVAYLLLRFWGTRLTTRLVTPTFCVVFLIALVAAFSHAWIAGNHLVRDLKAGNGISSTSIGGLHLLDIDAVRFRFTKIAKDHPFDRGCVMYLGHAEGRLVFFDTQRDQPISLREDEYDGEPLVDANGHAAVRCNPPEGDARLLVRAAHVADIDIARTATIWSEQQRPHDRWWLMAANDVGVPYALTSSIHAFDADLGRDAAGHLVITYRACTRDDRCALRVRALIGATVRPFAPPRRRGCTSRWPVEATRVAAVLLTGPHCSARSRGVWVRRPGRAWARVPTTGAAVGQLDAFDSQVAWLERRGPVGRVRTLRGGRLETLYLDSMGLDRLGSDIQSVRVVREGVIWTSQVGVGTTALLSHTNGATGCEANGMTALGEPTEWAFGGGRAVLATGSHIYASTEGDVEMGTGAPFARRGASGLATVGCPT